MTPHWISTSDLCSRLSMSRMALDRLRKGEDPLLHPGTHFINKGASINSGLLWDLAAVERTLADQTRDIHRRQEMPFISLNPDFSEGLTPEQNKAFFAITELIKDAKDRVGPGQPDVLCALLEGFAGTGKSFVAARIQKWCERYFHNPNLALELVAPTHKAAFELRKKLKENECAVTEVNTISRFLGKKKSYDGDGNKQFRVAPKDLPVTAPTLRVGVDELSMVSDQDFLLSIAGIGNRSRDPYPRAIRRWLSSVSVQPAVGSGEGDNTVFDPGEPDSDLPDDIWDVRVKLTEVVRHSGAILSLYSHP